MSHAEMPTELDQRLDTLLRGACPVDLIDDSPDALELQELIATARLTISALDVPLAAATQARHLRMLEAAAARWGSKLPRPQ
jgi:hypothetical protein